MKLHTHKYNKQFVFLFMIGINLFFSLNLYASIESKSNGSDVQILNWSNIVMKVQSKLKKSGYNVGMVDGKIGTKTKRAICKYYNDVYKKRIPLDKFDLNREMIRNILEKTNIRKEIALTYDTNGKYINIESLKNSYLKVLIERPKVKNSKIEKDKDVLDVFEDTVFLYASIIDNLDNEEIFETFFYCFNRFIMEYKIIKYEKNIKKLGFFFRVFKNDTKKYKYMHYFFEIDINYIKLLDNRTFSPEELFQTDKLLYPVAEILKKFKYKKFLDESSDKKIQEKFIKVFKELHDRLDFIGLIESQIEIRFNKSINK